MITFKKTLDKLTEADVDKALSLPTGWRDEARKQADTSEVGGKIKLSATGDTHLVYKRRYGHHQTTLCGKSTAMYVPLPQEDKVKVTCEACKYPRPYPQMEEENLEDVSDLTLEEAEAAGFDVGNPFPGYCEGEGG